jgi:hypothetical protein
MRSERALLQNWAYLRIDFKDSGAEDERYVYRKANGGFCQNGSSSKSFLGPLM